MARAATTGESRIWDLADEATRDLIVKTQVHRLLGWLSVLPATEAADKGSDIITAALASALSEAGGSGHSEVRRLFSVRVAEAATRLLEQET